MGVVKRRLEPKYLIMRRGSLTAVGALARFRGLNQTLLARLAEEHGDGPMTSRALLVGVGVEARVFGWHGSL